MRHPQALAGAAVAGLLLLSACSGGGEDVDLDGEEGAGAEASGAVLRAAIGGEPDQLDPNKTSSYFSF